MRISHGDSIQTKDSGVSCESDPGLQIGDGKDSGDSIDSGDCKV